ncbi:hypothetical protein BsWGS_05971 [Bradybaena similaris]
MYTISYKELCPLVIFSVLAATRASKVTFACSTAMYDLIYDFRVTLQYTVSGLKFTLPSPWDDVHCSESHCSVLSQHIENISACGYNTFTAINCSNHEISSRSERTSFTLQLSTAGGNPTSLKNCVEILRNQSETLFGPTNPGTANMSCLSPWSVNAATVDLVPENISCSNNSVMMDYNGMKYCLPCRPGMFFNTTTKNCQQCQDGYYQDEEGQAVCKTCPNGVLKSHAPRTKERHCFELCPEGFTSTSGYIEDNCTPCPENHFSISPSSCQPCPNNGSTSGISGATSVAQCSAMYDLIYDFRVTLQYTVSGLKFNLPSPWDDVHCSESHCSVLLQHIENISACGYNTFTAINCSNHEINSRSERTSFTLQLSTADGNPTSLRNCVEILRNQSETLFGPTYPGTANMACLSPWSVNAATVDIVGENSSCSNNSVMTDYNGMKYCFKCSIFE